MILLFSIKYFLFITLRDINTPNLVWPIELLCFLYCQHKISDDPFRYIKPEENTHRDSIGLLVLQYWNVFFSCKF